VAAGAVAALVPLVRAGVAAARGVAGAAGLAAVAAAGAGSGAARGVTVQAAESARQATASQVAMRVRCDPGALPWVILRTCMIGSSCGNA
jgi:hypothetical protein